ncbi:MAG: ABC transporter substrate-binding protein [Desulfuromonadales bacterium]|nr:ABC transporter substrate-binding protein [Desulfuromonadales bacterium]
MPAIKSIKSGFLAGLFVLIAVLFTLESMCAEAKGEKRVGVLWFGKDARYAELHRGALEQLAKEGFREPGVNFFIENAGGSKVKAAELARKFATLKLDLIFAFGTSAALAVATEIKDVPVVCGVYDPVASGLALDWKSSGNNTTGVSPKFPLSKLLSSLKELAPVNKLGVLYTPYEKNSEAVLKELVGLQDKFPIRIIPVPLTKEEEITELLPEVLRATDAIYLTGTGIVGKNLLKIVDMATKKKVVTLTHLDDLAEGGALLSMAVNVYKMGLLAGKKGAQILKGTKPSAIPYETLPLKQLELILNMKTVNKGGFRIPPSFMKKVTKTID